MRQTEKQKDDKGTTPVAESAEQGEKKTHDPANPEQKGDKSVQTDEQSADSESDEKEKWDVTTHGDLSDEDKRRERYDVVFEDDGESEESGGDSGDDSK